MPHVYDYEENGNATLHRVPSSTQAAIDLFLDTMAYRRPEQDYSFAVEVDVSVLEVGEYCVHMAHDPDRVHPKPYQSYTLSVSNSSKKSPEPSDCFGGHR